MNMNLMLIIIIFYISHLLMIITIPTVFSIDNYNSSVICSPAKGNSNYNRSVNAILYVLVDYAPKQSGFWSVSWGPDPADWAYGLALCYGHEIVTPEMCTTCLTNAAMSVTTNSCNNSREAIIWLDNCLLKYSDKPFFGQIDTDHKFYSFDDDYSTLSWSNDTDANTTIRLLNEQVVEATTDQTGNLYVFNNYPLTNGTVDVVVQCTRDLSTDGCRVCLKDIIDDLRSSDTLKSGGKLFSGSCYVNYHICNVC
ncbi:hypothetical protein CASFOL_031394 [Castilleja foliolosa]|uniref:Gnk2-homologous domain-containing protein n=1 Tax=Castilleja foliolosa TaxID=1961234 RepID=A0ABD3C4K5_9LAMI